MPVLKHTHTYIRHETRKKYMRCFSPHCTHVIEAAILRGKASLCTICGDEFVLTREDLRRAKPRCPKCSMTKEGGIRRDIESKEGLGKGIIPDQIIRSLFPPEEDPDSESEKSGQKSSDLPISPVRIFEDPNNV
jgi:hypothetical protein